MMSCSNNKKHYLKLSNSNKNNYQKYREFKSQKVKNEILKINCDKKSNKEKKSKI